DERSDVYSLGAILYEILALARPYTGSTPDAILLKVEEGRLVPPSVRAPGRSIPRELEAAVMKAMSPDPALRYASVAELEADIEAFLAGRTLAAAQYNPWQVLAKWARRNKPIVFGAAAAVLALAAGLAVMFGATRARRAAEAQELHAEAEKDWQAAESRYLWNPASPQAFFRSRVGALQKAGRSYELHPSPPQDWKRDLAGRSMELQEKAQEAGDWALAQVLANLPAQWHAVDDAEAARRASEVNATLARAASEDREHLDQTLARIAAAEARAKEQGALLPGEAEERARRLARASRTGLAAEVLTRLEDEERAPPASTARRLLVEILGRTGDVQATAKDSGLSAPRLIERTLSQDRGALEALGADEIRSWILAAARLSLVAPAAFGDVKVLLAGVAGKFDRDGPVAQAAARGLSILGTIGDPAAPLSRDSESYLAELQELGDWLSAAAQSGSEYTRYLLEKAGDEARLTTGQIVFVYDQIGLAGEDTPPEPGASPPSDLLLAAFEALPDEWLSDSVPPGTDPEARTRPREKAIHAAMALSRLGSERLAERLYTRRHDSQQFSTFWNKTELAFALTAPSRKDPQTAEEYLDRGLARQDQGDLVGAILDYDGAIVLRPDDARAYNNRGIARAAQGDLAGAILDYDRAIELKADVALAYVNRGNARKAQGDPAGAILDYDRAIELGRDFAEAYVTRGIARQAQGDVAGAILDYDRAIELKPDLAGAYVNRGIARYDQGDLPRAILDYDRAIELKPDGADAYSCRGNARRAQGDLAGAIPDFDRAIELKPDLAEAYGNRGAARAAQGDLAGAMSDCDRAIELKPDFANAYNNRGAARAAQGDPAGAIADFDRAIELKADDAGAYNNRGVARKAQGDLAGAMSDYDRAIELKPDFPDAYNNRGAARVDQGDPAGAIADFDRAIELKPDDAKAYNNRGIARQNQGDLAGAILDCDRALELKPDLALAYNSRASARKAQGDLAGAILDCDRAIELLPDYAEAYYNRGIARQAQGDLAGAIADCDRAIAIRPDYAGAYYNRGCFRQAQGDLASAIADYDRAIAIRPDYAAAYNNRGNARRAQGDLAGAIVDYDRTIALAAHLWQPWAMRGIALAGLGRRDEARESFDKAVSLCPPGQRASVESWRRQALGE
ncbi:MAG: tetratricopeptide repeat protein, partial [Planctomycetes bacterium]|nr:tetratricopeptide repeat protein [Planctomycetota bacterium]